MTRAEEISILRRRYRIAMAQRKWKTATLIWGRLQLLVARQLKAETRMLKRSPA